MYYVIYNHNVAMWVLHEEFIAKVMQGEYSLYGIATSRELADIKTQEVFHL